MAGNATSVEGNLTADPELRYTQVPREFTNSEASNGGN